MLEQINRSYSRAQQRRGEWEPVWRECYAYALPQKGGSRPLVSQHSGRRDDDQLFDSTAADASEQLAASLLAELMPPWSQWFGLRPGAAIDAGAYGAIAEQLDTVTERLQGHFDRSNFAVEMHQCLLDLVTIGTATLLFAESPVGATSAFEFHAVPPAEIFLNGDHNGRIQQQFRRTKMTLTAIRRSFPSARLPEELIRLGAEDPDRCSIVVESVSAERPGFKYQAFLEAKETHGSIVSLGEGHFDHTPLISFRWLKAAGEIYGRSPVMTALPDIRTANKVVELVLKNASIAVSGMWLADDDGVLNPANIKLGPGTIIPKAAGSAGLTPLQAPGRFDVSELVLNDLRERIRHTMLIDRLGPVNNTRMTATEVLERSTETARLLGAVFGRLQAELVTPLIGRALSILRRRGEIGEIFIDGRTVEIEFKSPLARAQAREDVGNALMWLETVHKLGGEALEVSDRRAAAIWLARALGVPSELVRHDAQLPFLDLTSGATARTT
jgi:hypothetical protein